MRLSKDISKLKHIYLVEGDGSTYHRSLKEAEAFIKEEMWAYKVERECFTIYLYSEIKQKVLSS